jgi:hypothetical protein
MAPAKVWTSLLVTFSVSISGCVCCVSKPRFRGEVRAWGQSSGWGVILSSSFVAFFGSTRVWPALSRYKRKRRKTDAWRRRRSSAAGVKATCSIEKAALLSVLRRWCPMSRLEAWHMAVCDHAQRPPRYDPGEPIGEGE